jgi:hypothetical protein
MSNFMSDDEHKEWKKGKLEAIRDYHQELINDLKILRTDFNMKMPFYSSTGQMVVGIFASEFKKEKGFFFELVTRGLEPINNERTVYRVQPSETFQDEYELNEKGSYLVALDELRTVNPQSVAISKSSAVTSSDRFNTKQAIAPTAPEVLYKAPAPMEDLPYSEMTIRDYYAIHTGKPVSVKTWLNELIKQK